MSVLVAGVEKKSIAHKKRISAGDTLVSINEKEINDVLDYQFYSSDKKLIVELTKPDGKKYKRKIRKDEYEDLGLIFETYLMDKKHKCIFCFIDQLPMGMRESLYFKDDDSRLSFLFGNYITLTNITQHDVDRIIEMHISPVNISVHTMNHDLRTKMMKNPFAGESLKYIEQFAKAGIKLNTQLVLCPGINDGDELKYSIEKLMSFYPAVQSIAAVPVGLTKHRENLCHIEPYNKETAGEVIDIIEKYSSEYLEHIGTRIVFAADEFYLKAERPIPEADFYEDFPQIENGVGLWADLKNQFKTALNECEYMPKESRTVVIATGKAAYPLMVSFKEAVENRFDNINVNVIKIENNFFGEMITVSGLITGKDLITQLKGKTNGNDVLISSTMLRSEGDMFLDSMTLCEAEKELGSKIISVDNDGYELLSAILGDM